MTCKLFLALTACLISLNTQTGFYSPVPLTTGEIAGAILNHVANTVIDGVNQTAVPVAESIVHNRYYLIGSRLAFWGTAMFFIYWIARYINDNRNVHQKTSTRYKDQTLTLTTDNPVIVQEHNGPWQIGTIYEEQHVAPQQNLNPLLLLRNAWRWLWRPPYNPASITQVLVPFNTKINIHTTNPYSHRRAAIETHNIHGEQILTADRGNIRIVEPTGHVTADAMGDLEVENFSAQINAKGFSSFIATRRQNSTAPVYVLSSTNPEPIQSIYAIDN